MHNLALNLIAAVVAALPGANMSVTQDAPPAPERRVEQRVVVIGGPGGPGGHAGLDGNSDGFITRDELLAPLDAHWSRLDADGDGRVPVSELQAMHHGGPGGEDRDVVIMRHGSGGPDGPGGHAGAAEHHAMMMRHGGPAGPGEHRIEIRRMGGHGEMDKDGDGRVSEEEFLSPMRDAFRQMDADNSGSLEQGERQGSHTIHHSAPPAAE